MVSCPKVSIDVRSIICGGYGPMWTYNCAKYPTRLELKKKEHCETQGQEGAEKTDTHIKEETTENGI